ncbi:TonB-dependent receptor [Alloacidobacterium dinghuense]|uniref:TonB-dependent receptor n=1 Tax=Alloacidobacterium dinghuense TaxID=2763107 RepID=UPI002556D09A|nr:TonB-dependent receptor [Alloacidobacterium dinghuense]
MSACAVLLFLSVQSVVAQRQTTERRRSGRLEGTVSEARSAGKLYLAGARVQALGPITMETKTNGEGAFVFDELPPGTYKLTASAQGMDGEQTVTLTSNQVVRVLLLLKPARVTTTIDVSTADTAKKTPSPVQTIGEKTLTYAPNVNERMETLLPLVPGVVRGPDGHINLKGARNTQSGALVNSANVTDPVTGSPAINLPIDVVESVQVVSNPYDPEYGRFTGAVSSVETKTGSYEKRHFSIQNILPRWRDRDGSIVGIGAATPRMTLSGPLIKDKLSLIQSFEYRFVRTPVNSLPPLQRDTTQESVDTYSQVDLKISPQQTATMSLAVYPQKLQYMGLNTFTPQPATADFHQRGYEIYGQHRYLTGAESALISQLSYKTYDADVTAQNNEPYQLLIDTTRGGYFNRQERNTWRLEGQETYQLAPRHFVGEHELKAGLNATHSSYIGHQVFLPVELIGGSGSPVEQITFTAPTSYGVTQSETAWFASDKWSPKTRLTFDLGVRFDSDTVTGTTHAAPRTGFIVLLTKDGRTLLKGGVGMFYDRVPLMFPAFERLPQRTVWMFDASGQASSSTLYLNRIVGGLHNPESIAWSAAIERQVLEHLAMRFEYEQRNTTKDFTVSPLSSGNAGIIALSNAGRDFYREFQVAARYSSERMSLNGSYARSRAYGNLNDPALFFGNYPQAVIQPDARARLPFDAPNRFLFWADIAGPKRFTLIPVYDLHTGFPYSPWNEFHEYAGPRNERRYPRFSSMDLQVSRPFSLHVRDSRRLQVRVGFGVFNVFNHFNPRDVQNNVASNEFGEFLNDAWREYRGKFVFQF